MSHAIARYRILLAVLVQGGCGAPGAAPGGPGSVTTYLHGQTVVTFGTLSR